jgi:hypothetical protein
MTLQFIVGFPVLSFLVILTIFSIWGVGFLILHVVNIQKKEETQPEDVGPG